MKKNSTVFLKFVIFLIATGALVGMAWFPQIEGRAANLDLIRIYSDPFILYLYAASLPFFGSLYQAFKLLGLVDQNKIFSQTAINTVRNIQYFTFAFIAFLVSALLYIRFFIHGEDSAGPTMLGFVIIFICVVIATALNVFQKLLQNAVDIKSENDLTV